MARRRILVVIAAALLAAAIPLLVIAATGGEGSHRATFAVENRPGPVLLVPGYGGSRAALVPLANRLRAAGRQVEFVTLPGDATGDLRAQAAALAAVARAAAAAGPGSVDVVGYSAGGVVARLWARDLGGAAIARRVITLGSPHHGTELAELAEAIAPDSCPVACRQLTPDSSLLQSLNSGDETPAGPLWTTVWTAQDEVVTPPDSGQLAGAIDVPLQSVCPGDRVAHGDLPKDPAVIGVVLRALGPGLRATPMDCSGLRALGGVTEAVGS